MVTSRITQWVAALAAILTLSTLAPAGRAQTVLSDRGGVSIRVIAPYGWGSSGAHLVIYPVGSGSGMLSRYTSLSGLYVGRLHAGRYLVNARGFEGGFGTGEFVVRPGEHLAINVALVGTAFTRLHHRHWLGLWHAEHRLHRDRVMVVMHRMLASRTAVVRSRAALHGSAADRLSQRGESATPGQERRTATDVGGDEWDRLARGADEPAPASPARHNTVAGGSGIRGGTGLASGGAGNVHRSATGGASNATMRPTAAP